jgi:hypothetical protein
MRAGAAAVSSAVAISPKKAPASEVEDPPTPRTLAKERSSLYTALSALMVVRFAAGT